ncbi:MAG: IS66 family insertion sequence element accessory protein TnpB [Nitrospirae bacterium]|nr:IS66 family insertion sequence element accessory protein TnpB [Nitrospirota bacterium]
METVLTGHSPKADRDVGVKLMYRGASNMRVYLAGGSTDMRKSINGLSMLVEEVMELPSTCYLKEFF